MSKNSRKVTQKPEGRFVNGACELQLSVRQSLSGGRIGDFSKVDLYIFRSNDSGRRGKRCHSFWYGTQLAPWQAYLMALCGSFFVVCFLAFFTHWFYVECKKHGFLKRFIGWIDKIVTKNKDKIHKYGPLAIFAYVAVPIPGTGTMDRKHHCRGAEHETGHYHFLCNVRKCCGGDDRDAGKFRRYSFVSRL